MGPRTLKLVSMLSSFKRPTPKATPPFGTTAAYDAAAELRIQFEFYAHTQQPSPVMGTPYARLQTC